MHMTDLKIKKKNMNSLKHKILFYVIFSSNVALLFISAYIQPLDLNNQLIHRNGFSLSYNEKHEQPNWVFYKILPSDIQCIIKAKRKNRFKPDLEILSESAGLIDYYKSGFDRGHLKPSADELCDQSQMNETFLMSNMSPQTPGFNRGIWKSLESHVRGLIKSNDSLYVYTAGVLSNGLPTIGMNKVSVPEKYYKVIYKFKDGNISTESYIIPNSRSEHSFDKYQTSVLEVEKITGIDFPNCMISFSLPLKN